MLLFKFIGIELFGFFGVKIMPKNVRNSINYVRFRVNHIDCWVAIEATGA